MIETPEKFVAKIKGTIAATSGTFPEDVLAIFISVRDAAIRAECAERAVAYCKKWAEFPIGNHGVGALRAAIMAEPKEKI